jgi:hypothetical protein
LIAVENQLFVYAGNRYGYYVPDLFQFDTDTCIWQNLEVPTAPSGRWGHSWTFYGGNLWVYGGIDLTGSVTIDLFKFEFGPHRTKFFKKFLKNTLYSDLEIKVEETKYPCHKVVLSQSEYFREFIKSEGAEILEISTDVFEKILYYLYAGSPSFGNVHILDVVKWSRIFKLEYLETQCANQK